MSDARQKIVLDRLRELLETVPDADIVRYSSSPASPLVTGFRVAKPASARLALQTVLASRMYDLPEGLRGLMSRFTPVVDVVSAFDEKLLRTVPGAFGSFMGEALLIAAFLLDDRSELRDYAKSLIDSEGGVSASEEEFQKLRDKLAPFCGNAGEVAKLPGIDDVRKQAAQIQSLRDELTALKGSSERLDRALLKIKKLDETVEVLEKKLAVSETALTQTRRESEAFRLELEREVNHREERIRAMVELKTAHEFFGWVGRASIIEAEALRDSSDDVIARAQAALKRQEQTDRNSGNRGILSDRLTQLEALHRDVIGMLEGAIHVVPELTGSEQELRAECEKIRTLLEEPYDPLLAEPWKRILAQTAATADVAKLDLLRKFPDSLENLGVVDKPTADALRQIWYRRAAALQATGSFIDKDALAEFESSKNGVVAKFENVLAGSEPALLMIDGHNVLFGIPGRYSASRGRARTDSEKREMLVTDVAHLLESVPTVRGWIVFDGATRTDSSPASNVQVSFSGGKGEHRADGVLLDQIRFFRSRETAPAVFLVSNDNGLCGAARKLGAQTLAVHQLAAFLK